MKVLMVLLILVSLLQSCVVSFDYYMLSEMWPPGYCVDKSCDVARQSKLSMFIIHGLWPQNAPSCKPSVLGDFKDPKLVNELDKKWPSITRQTNQRFWQGEWDKHGSCSMLDAQEYFKLTLELYDRADIKKILKKNNITAEVTLKSFPKEEIENAIKPHIENTKPQLVCIQGNLAEVRLCFDKTPDYKYINCPASSTCPNLPEKIKFPYLYPNPKPDDPMDPEEGAIPPL
ncbi:hypothetical protein RYX36_036806 [Vicia faba]